MENVQPLKELGVRWQKKKRILITPGDKAGPWEFMLPPSKRQGNCCLLLNIYPMCSSFDSYNRQGEIIKRRGLLKGKYNIQ